MKVKNGKIAEATEAELFEFYLSRGLDEIMSFPDFKTQCVRIGTRIVEEGGEKE